MNKMGSGAISPYIARISVHAPRVEKTDADFAYNNILTFSSL